MRRSVQHLQSVEVRWLSSTQRWLIAVALLIGLIYALTPEAIWKPRLTSWSDWLQDSEQSVTSRSDRTSRGLHGDALARARQRLAAKRGIPLIDESVEENVSTPTQQNLAEPQLVASAETKTDEKKKTVDGKKKKKKDKDEKEKKVSVATVDRDPSKSSPPSGNDGGDAFAMAPAANGPAAEQSVDVRDPQTLEEWLSYILREPNYDRSIELIERHQSGKVDPATFHLVVQEMLEDSRSKMHELAVLALGSAPSSRSFVTLHNTSLKQESNSELRFQIRTYVKAYSRLENIRHLVPVISANILGDSELAFEAVRLVQAAVDQQVRVQRAGQPTSSSVAPLPASSPIARQFSLFVPVLARTTLAAQDSNLRNEADRTRRSIESILGSGGTAVAAAL